MLTVTTRLLVDPFKKLFFVVIGPGISIRPGVVRPSLTAYREYPSFSKKFLIFEPLGSWDIKFV